MTPLYKKTDSEQKMDALLAGHISIQKNVRKILVNTSRKITEMRSGRIINVLQFKGNLCRERIMGRAVAALIGRPAISCFITLCQ